jgi:hypothetical protein
VDAQSACACHTIPQWETRQPWRVDADRRLQDFFAQSRQCVGRSSMGHLESDFIQPPRMRRQAKQIARVPLLSITANSRS